jgi:hypothetical protein
MDEMDVFAAMGIAGFGKSNQKKKLDPARFDKNKRDEVPAKSSQNEQVKPREVGAARGPEPKPESKSDEPGPSSKPPPQGEQEREAEAEEEFEPEFEPDDPDGDAELPQFPITHEITLKDHTKVVSALALDPSGARIVSGSHDYDCKLWDFGGMDMRCKPFKSWEPAGTYHIHDLKYTNDGQKFLVVSGTTQAKLYDRDGEEQATYIKGDPYIRDMKHTSYALIIVRYY